MSILDGFEYVDAQRNRLQPGKYLCMIRSVENTKTKAGAEMLTLKLRISGVPFDVTYHIVDNAYKNENLSRFFDAFPMLQEEPNLNAWVGAVGAVQLRRDKNNDDYLEVQRFLKEDDALGLGEFRLVEREDEKIRRTWTDDRPPISDWDAPPVRRPEDYRDPRQDPLRG